MRPLEVRWQNELRRADFFIPSHLNAPLPVVLMLHGAGGDSIKAAQQTNWCELAEREGFAVVFPNGLPVDSSRPNSFLRNPQVWNSGVERGLGYVPRVDDVGFINALLDEINRTIDIDTLRIFATGFSNGGGMCWRLALELSHKIAAVAPVCSYVSVPQPWTPSKEVSAIVINCLDDPFIPLDGGPVKDIWSRVEIMRPSVNAAIQSYADLLGCELSMSEQIAPDVCKKSYRKLPFDQAPSTPRLEFYTIANAGHAYPGAPPLLSERIAGKTTDALNATEVIWQFFKSVGDHVDAARAIEPA